MLKIGFPRGLLYYEYYSLWEAFFSSLGMEIVTSPNTNKDILDYGVLNCVDEACLPVKIYHGHVYYLKDKVDYLFIPRYISLSRREYNCPKHLGISDMISNYIDDLPTIIAPKIIINNKKDLYWSMYNVAKKFTKNHFLIVKACKNSIDTYNKRKYLKNKELLSVESKALSIEDKIKLLVIGHKYNVKDSFVNMGIIDKLNNDNIRLIFEDDISMEEIETYSKKLSKRMFWTQGKQIVGSAFSLIEKKCIDGIIYLSAFGCGLDSVLIHIIEDEAIKNKIPLIVMTFDEQTGEAGFNTRLEAFIDMMNWRVNIEDNISSLR